MTGTVDKNLMKVIENLVVQIIEEGRCLSLQDSAYLAGWRQPFFPVSARYG